MNFAKNPWLQVNVSMLCTHKRKHIYVYIFVGDTGDCKCVEHTEGRRGPAGQPGPPGFQGPIGYAGGKGELGDQGYHGLPGFPGRKV